MPFPRVVITGLGAITPLGNSVADFWQALLAGKSGAGAITQFDASKFKTRFACEVKGFDPSYLLDKKEVRKLDRFAHFALASADEAIRDAGFDLEKLDKDRTGVIWGSGIGGIKTFDMEFEKEFNISIPDEKAETITTVGQAIAYLEEGAK